MEQPPSSFKIEQSQYLFRVLNLLEQLTSSLSRLVGPGLNMSKSDKDREVKVVANAVTLPVTGHYFILTGSNVTVNQILPKQSGRIVYIEIDKASSATFVHNTNDIDTLNNANMAATAGSVAMFICLRGTHWKELVYAP